MKDLATDAAGNWIGMFFAGLGVSFAAHEWVGGMFLALAGAAFAMRKTNRTETVVKVLLGAFIASHVGALLIHSYWPEVPLQIPMAIIGLFSQQIMRIAFGFGDKVESRADVITDKLIDKIISDSGDKKE